MSRWRRSSLRRLFAPVPSNKLGPSEEGIRECRPKFLVVDRLDAGSVDRQQLAPEKIEPPAQQHELAEHGAEGGAIVASKVGDGLEVRIQGPHQPDDFNVAMAFHFQPPARPHPVQIAVDVELQQIGWRIAGAARRRQGSNKSNTFMEWIDR